MNGSRRVIAVDLGAGSIRVTVVDLGAAKPHGEVVHRWRNSPIVAADGSLRWDWPRIVSEVHKGISKALALGPVASIGVDGWAVDYGLLDRQGELITLPYSYRDRRTQAWASVAEKIGVDRIYGITGIQLMGVNTVYQLAFHDRSELDRAALMLLLPDLLVHQLSGFRGAERSNASTTGLLGIRDGEWSSELVEAIGIPRRILPDVVPAAQPAGLWQGIPVTTVGSHDTASAFLGMPGQPTDDTVLVSAGTWVIVGIERAEPLMSPRSRAANFANERGGLGGFRCVKNLTGFWMLDQCRAAWGNPPVDELIGEAEGVVGPIPLVDAADERFISPPSMLEEIVAAAGFHTPPSRGQVVRCIIESIAQSIAEVIDELAAVSGTRMSRVFVVGGASNTRLFTESIARRSAAPVVVGSPEASALGNAIAQGIGIGHFRQIEEARGWLEGTGSVI